MNNLFVEPEYQDNPLALVIYQPPVEHPQMAAAQPPFPFPIPPQQGNQNMKNIPSDALPKFYGLITEDLETFPLNLTFFVEVMTTQLMPIS